jgi:hypothetical protein
MRSAASSPIAVSAMKLFVRGVAGMELLIRSEISKGGEAFAQETSCHSSSSSASSPA